MRALLIEPFQAGYMRRAILEVVLLGVLGGVVGVHVLLRRLSFLTEVVQHTVFPGIAIAFAFGQSLLVGALTTGLASVVLLALLG
ncbi:MAG: metal ABC transporter permease, partial [Ilumatobacteraceae bacterium]